MQQGQAKDALDYYQKCMQIRQRLAEADPKNAQAQRDLCVSFNSLGGVAMILGQARDALDYYQKSRQIAQHRAEEDPKNVQAQEDLFISYFNLGRLAEAEFDFGAAGEWYGKGRDVVLPWHEKKLLTGRFKSAIAVIDQKIFICHNTEKASADIEFIFMQKSAQISDLLAIRVKLLLKRKQPADALSTAERFAEWAEKQLFDRNEQRYNAACAFALCAATSDKPDPLVEKALALLTKAKSGDNFSPQRIAHIKQDADFNGIRQHPKFVQFMAELEAKK
jgi:tetratricopeptide (TPR) repeat protein